MMRGTTPIHTFTVDIDTSSLAKVRVVYCQGNKRILAKEDCQMAGNTITVKLTQAETFLFEHNKPVEVQIRARTKGGEAHNSEIYTEPVERCLDTEVI